MKLERRAFLRTAGVVGASLLAPALGGCGADDDALTFFFQANPEEAEGRMRVIAEFARRHPEIKVRTVLSGPDPMQQMFTFCAGGKCPDVLMAWELTYAALAERGVLLDLNGMLDRDPEFAKRLHADSIPALYDTFAFKGGQYALPEQWSGNFLFYNRKILAAAGRTPPANWKSGWGFAEFLDTARALTTRDRSGRVRQWGFVDTWVPHYSAGLFGLNNGVEWAVPHNNPTRANFADDAFIEGVQFYADLSNRHGVAPTPAELQSFSTMDLFAQGKAALAMGGHWRWSSFSGAEDLDFDVTALPGGPKGQGGRSNIGTTGLAIAADSPRRDQAWEFLKFAAGPEGQAVIAESGLFVPVLHSAVRSAGFTEAHTRVRNLDILTSGAAHANPLPVTGAWARVDALMGRSFGPVLRGSAAATTLRDRLAPDADEVLRNQ
ncbi:sugar ABC transporter substrate-binding protein [Nocardia panacis]|uniref:Sugar ABC transporter substrate-binding protein n=1 Tax=Nocardia panacis TaxID=2340916 RepID=A0A3A4KAX8_9NOCA|nr:sugar ABC transporter substrate-binding protein [Nocardia panacis]RJO75205.1 sugar ABC transporter substrate-binding protein [Nocardia panacis]